MQNTLTEQDYNNCREVVRKFIQELNDWEIKEHILARLRDGLSVPRSRAQLVESLSYDEHFSKHAQLFHELVFPERGKYSSQPGKPASICREGRFFCSEDAPVFQVEKISDSKVSVTTNWAFMDSDGVSRFELIKHDNRWVIRRLFTRDSQESPWKETEF